MLRPGRFTAWYLPKMVVTATVPWATVFTDDSTMTKKTNAAAMQRDQSGVHG